MEANTRDTGRLPAAFLTPGSSSFMDFLSEHAPELLPGNRALPAVQGAVQAPHGTTIVAATYPGGVVLAGDRRATMGNVIAQRDIEKVFPADEYSAVGIAGTAGLAVEMVKLFQLELEHFEKVEGSALSLEGKANRLSTMIRSNLGMALQGLAVVPVFAGLRRGPREGPDLLLRRDGRPLRGGGLHRRRLGLGLRARLAEEAVTASDLTEEQASTVVLQALYDAADDDSATGGPDMARRIYPIVTVITDEGCRRLAEDEVSELVRTMHEGRLQRPERAAGPALLTATGPSAPSHRTGRDG